MKYTNTAKTLGMAGLVLTSCTANNQQEANTDKNQPNTEQKPAKPNVILIMADDMGYGDVGFMGNDSIHTPHLDQMAKDGITFERFYAAAPVCSPTRASCLTGRHPKRFGILSANVGKLKPEEINLAELLQEQGYRTGHFGKWHLGTLTTDTLDANRGGRPEAIDEFAPPWINGFDVCFSTESKVPTYNPMRTPEPDAGGVHNKPLGSYYGTRYWTGPGQVATENLQGDDSRVIMDRAIPFMEQAVQQNKPFFSVIWFHTPHSPVVASDSIRQQYAKFSENRSHYYGCITALDAQVGRLRQKLAQMGIDSNTVIFFTSDNGQEKIEHGNRNLGSSGGLRGRKATLFEGGIRVPGIALYPGTFTAGVTQTTPAYTSDYLPTVLAMLKVQYPDTNRPIDGQNILPLLVGEHINRKPMAFWYYNRSAYLKGDYKIISTDSRKTYALYNLKDDYRESNDLSNQLPQLKQEIIAEFDAWATSVDSSAKGLDY